MCPEDQIRLSVSLSLTNHPAGGLPLSFPPEEDRERPPWVSAEASMERGGGEPGWKDGRVKMNRESARATQGTRKRKGKEVAMWHLEVGAGRKAGDHW